MTSEHKPPVRGFRATFVAIGVLYVALASSMLVRGVGVMRDFAVPEDVIHAPVFRDFFSFFYELMAAQGVLIALFGQLVRERRSQAWVALVLCVWNVYVTWRDLSTSDSPLGNQLYRGTATLIPVFLDLSFALVFAGYAWAAWRPARGTR
ncbi:MAG TPA: hypothetical protein VFZ61_16990 [Polyangiales bacterium]